MSLKSSLICTFTHNMFCLMQFIEESPNIQLAKISAYMVYDIFTNVIEDYLHTVSQIWAFSDLWTTPGPNGFS